jgi:hypothetical protein
LRDNEVEAIALEPSHQNVPVRCIVFDNKDFGHRSLLIRTFMRDIF